MTFIKNIILIFVLVFCSSAFGTERPAYFDFSVAYPKEIKAFETDHNIPRRFKEFFVIDTLYLDKKGNIDTLIFEDTTLNVYNEYISNYLKEIEFEPAQYKGKKIKSLLPIKVHYRPYRYTRIIYPVNDSLQIENRELYFNATRSNSVFPPELITFPSVYCDLNPNDTMPGYQYIVVKVDIDSTGRGENMELFKSTYPAFEHQIKFSTLYARYKPAMVMGEKVSSSAYIIVRFFNELPYPTNIWHAADFENANYLEQNMVELIPEQIGFLSPPIAKNSYGDKAKHADFKLKTGENLVCWIMIDDFGGLYIRRMSPGILKSDIRKVKAQYQRTNFYPALGFDGSWQVAEGMARIEPLDESYVRIEYIW